MTKAQNENLATIRKKDFLIALDYKPNFTQFSSHEALKINLFLISHK